MQARLLHALGGVSKFGLGIILAVMAVTTAAEAAVGCKNTGSFGRWLKDFRREAIASGITKRTVRRTLNGVKYDPRIIRRDRRQSFFAQSFLDFSGKLATKNRRVTGRRQIKKYKKTFVRAQKQYGVPPEVITAYWALESDFGKGMGNLSVLRSLATLAYDCRRAEMFRAELLAALRVVDRGDLNPSDMIGSWAGELGQTQMLPTHYYKHAIDYDGDGRTNLFKSPYDIIGSSAKYLKYLGWRAGEPWLQEVRVPKKMDWSKSDLSNRFTRAQWAKWGVRQSNGRPLIQDNLKASLMLPMGRRGPAFLAYDNFRVYIKWNQSLNYSLTAAYLATRIAGADAMRRPKGIPKLTFKQNKQLQRQLVRRGHDVGAVDGHIGAKTRSAVKAVQIKLGLPADGYPTPRLLSLLRRGS